MYNAGKYVGDCLRSILNQGLSYNDFEIIVIDDGSSDDGKDIVRGFKERVNYIYQENRGQSSARNIGLEYASGQYICFVDSDDMLVSNSIKTVLEKAIEMDVDMLTYDMASQYEEVECGESISKIVTGPEYISNNNYNNGPCWYIVKKNSIGDLRFVEGRFGEDGMFTMELLMKIKRVAHMNRHCYYYIRRQGSTTTRKDESHMRKMISDYLFVYHYMQQLIKQYRESLSASAVRRCEQRSETYLFFLLVRLLRFPDGAPLIKKTIREMRELGIYPVKKLNKVNYPGLKFNIIYYIINRPYLLISVNWIYGLLKR